MNKPTIEDLVDVFAASAIAQDNAREAEVGNVHARRAIKAFESLVELYGDAGREGLTVLLKHADPGVRCRAAAFLLRYAHDDAMAVLKELAAGKGLVAFAAQCSMMNWKNGDWELDVVEQK